MGTRAGVRTRFDPSLEDRLADTAKQLADIRRNEAVVLTERNRLFYMMFHGNGYTQKRIFEIANRRLDPSDPSYCTEATVEKALIKMR